MYFSKRIVKMDGCYVRNGDGMNFESMSELPTSDPLVWNIDEGD